MSNTYRLTFEGFLAVRLMEFDYGGKHYSYHGKKLERAVDRLMDTSSKSSPSAAELTIWGQAVHDWKALGEDKPCPS